MQGSRLKRLSIRRCSHDIFLELEFVEDKGKYFCKMKVIDNSLLDKISADAKESPRLRMNYNFLRPSE